MSTRPEGPTAPPPQYLDSRLVVGVGILLLVGAFLVLRLASDRSTGDGRPAVLSPNLVLVRPGGFLMGSTSDEPGHDKDELQRDMVVVLPFAMSESEVTRAQYHAVVKPRGRLDLREGERNKPQEVSFEEALFYSNRLSKIAGLELCYELDAPGGPLWKEKLGCTGFRLPTEVEWEYAARAGTTSLYWSGDSEENLARVGWYRENSDGEAHPVKEKDGNPWGFYDVHGNLREWVWDPYCIPPRDGDSQPARDCDQPRVVPARVVRDGSFADEARHTRSANRCGQGESYTCGHVGFRVARSLGTLPSGIP